MVVVSMLGHCEDEGTVSELGNMVGDEWGVEGTQGIEISHVEFEVHA